MAAGKTMIFNSRLWQSSRRITNARGFPSSKFNDSRSTRNNWRVSVVSKSSWFPASPRDRTLSKQANTDLGTNVRHVISAAGRMERLMWSFFLTFLKMKKKKKTDPFYISTTWWVQVVVRCVCPLQHCFCVCLCVCVYTTRSEQFTCANSSIQYTAFPNSFIRYLSKPQI